MKQFINGICRICGKDHRDVMKDDTLQRYVALLYDQANSGGDDEFSNKLYQQRMKYKDIDVLRAQLDSNLARIERCERAYKLGIGYEWLVTLNFSEDLEVEQLKIYIEKLLKSNFRYLKCGKFVVEYHTKEGNHWHIHIALKTLCGRKKSSIITQLAKQFNLAKNFVDIRKTFTDPEDYVEGIKTDSKQEYIGQDIYLRNKLKLKHLYII